MYTISYHYRVPEASEASYIALQRQLSSRYLSQGCVRYLVLKPMGSGQDWMELASFPSREAYQRAEEALRSDGWLDTMYREFLQITQLKPPEIRETEWCDVLDVHGSSQEARP